jgi:stage VI sporulation protein D
MRGGVVLSNENQSYLRFSLEEAVWFQKGQEVAELYSISLDPNVTIQERDQYVVIKGTLDLSGEYKEEERNGESEPKNYIQNHHPKTIHEVNRGDSGLNVFIHRFPVDITIPYNRINSLNDVDVEIQTFDYILPEKNCLKLQADLLITGIYREQTSAPAGKAEEYMEYEYKQSNEAPYENNYNESPGQKEHVYDHVPPRYLYEENMAEREAHGNDETVEESAAVDHLQAEAEYRQPAGPAAEEGSLNGRNRDLYQPFFAEAKKLHDEAREEDTQPHPALLSKQPEIPVFQIPVEPLYEELNTKMSELLKEPEKGHPLADVQQASFIIDEEPVPLQQPFTKPKQQSVQEERIRDTVEPKQQSVQEERIRDTVEPKQQSVQEERIRDLVEPKQEPVQEEPVRVTVEAEQEPVQEEPVRDTVKAEQQPVQAEPILDTVKEERRPIQAEPAQNYDQEEEPDPVQDVYAPIFNLVRKPDMTSDDNSVNQGKERSNVRDDDQVSLMDFFGRKQEEELTKVKVCIVQYGDTLSSLAERYQVSVPSIQNSNALDQGQDVYEGQVLYIPKTPAYKL